MRRISATFAAALLVLAGLAACGDDDGAALGTEEFCDLLVELEETEDGDLSDSEDIAEAVAVMDQLLSVAPAGLRGDLQLVRDKFAEIAELDVDEDDPGASFGAFFALAFDPELVGALERLEEFGVEECGLDPTDGSFSDIGDPGDDLGGIDDDGSATDGWGVVGGVVSEVPMPDDVTLTRRSGTMIDWEEVDDDDVFTYRVEVDGRTLGTTFHPPFIALGDRDGEVVVEALARGQESLGPVSDVSTTSTEVLVVEWTEEPGGTYYVGTSVRGHGSSWQLASSPFVIEFPADDVEAVRFGPGVLAEGEDGPRVEIPFDHGEDFYVELPLP